MSAYRQSEFNVKTELALHERCVFIVFFLTSIPVLGVVIFAGSPLWLVILVGVIYLLLLALWAAMDREKISEKVSEEIRRFKTRCKKDGLTFKSDFSIEVPDGKSFLIGVSEEKSQLLIGVIDGGGVMDGGIRDWFIDVKDVLSVELSLNDNSVYQAGSIASLAAAAVGGLTFGGSGAVVGSLTAGRMSAGEISELAINLRMDSVDWPLTKIRFISGPIKSSFVQPELELAEKWTNLIEVMRHRLANSDKNNT